MSSVSSISGKGRLGSVLVTAIFDSFLISVEVVVVVVVTTPLASSNDDDEEDEEPLVLLVVLCVSTRPLTSTPARLEADADLVEELKVVVVAGGFLPTTFCNSAPSVTETATGEGDRDLAPPPPPPPFVDRDRERRFWPESDDDDDDCLL